MMKSTVTVTEPGYFKEDNYGIRLGNILEVAWHAKVYYYFVTISSINYF